MKKYLALLAAVMLLVFAGSAFAANSPSDGGHATPSEPTEVIVTPPVVNTDEELVEPTNPDNPNEPEPQPEDSGSEEAKGVEAAESTETVEEEETVTVAVTEEVEYPAITETEGEEGTVITESTFEDSTESSEETERKLTIDTDAIDEETSAALDETLSIFSEGEGTVTTENASEAMNAAVDALADSGAIPEDADKEGIAELMTSAVTASEAGSDGETTQTVDTSKVDSKRREGETFTQALVRISIEAVQGIGRNHTAAAERIRQQSGVPADVPMPPVGEGAQPSETPRVTNNTDATRRAHEQAAQSGNKFGSDMTVVGTNPTMTATRRSVVTIKNTNGKSTQGKKAEAFVIRDEHTARSTSFGASAIDMNQDGSSVLLNSAGNPTDHIPGNGEWEISAATGEEVLVVPGYTTTAVFMVPGVDYTPLTMMSTTELGSAVTATTETQEVVTGTETVTQAVSIPVYHSSTAGYSTSFDVDLKASFKGQGYSTSIGRYIIPGAAGVWNATDDSGDVMLNAYSRAVVRTLPKMKVSGDAASTEADYVIRIRFSIPKNTEKRIVSGDNLLEFYSNGLTRISGDKAYPNTAGEAKFLTTDGKSELTDEMVEAIARGELGEAIDEDNQGYVGYVVMHLAKQADDADPYRPVVVVKRAEVISSTPDNPVNPDNPNTPTNDVGSSGGGCSAGFSALALAILGGFIAARKK